MSHLAHEARSWNYAKGRGWEFGCLAPNPVLPHRGTFRVQAHKGQSNPELPHSPWVRMTVIFVAENVESHGFLLPFSPLSSLSPTMNVFIVRTAILP